MLEKAKKTSQFFTVEHPKPYKSTAYSKSTRRAKHSSSAGSELDPAETVSDDRYEIGVIVAVVVTYEMMMCAIAFRSDFSDSSDEEDAAEGNFKIAREFDSGKASGDSVSADATGGPASPSMCLWFFLLVCATRLCVQSPQAARSAVAIGQPVASKSRPLRCTN